MTDNLFGRDGNGVAGLNYAKAAEAVNTAAQRTADPERTFSKVTAAALVDIAVSLASIAAALEALGGSTLTGLDDDREAAPDPVFEVGDYVTVNGHTAPILSLGVREGEPAANLTGLGWFFLSYLTPADRPATDDEGFDFDDEGDDDSPDEGFEDDNDEADEAAIDGKAKAEVIETDADEPSAGAECAASHPTTTGVACARKPEHDGKHRKGNLKWA